MSALERIAELHRVSIYFPGMCDACDETWPCPTRRLCDEVAVQATDAAIHNMPTPDDVIAEWRQEAGNAKESPWYFAERIIVLCGDTSQARVDADRLAAAAREVCTECDVRALNGPRRGWCMAHSEYLRSDGCPMARLADALAAHDAARDVKEGLGCERPMG